MERKRYLSSDGRAIAAGSGLVVLVVLLSGLLSGQSQAAPLSLPTLTRRVTPTRTPVTNALKKQLVFGGMGAGANPVDCSARWLARLSGLPGVISPGRMDPEPMDETLAQNYVGLCIFGLPYDQGFSIDLYRPDGSLAGHGEFQAPTTYADDFGWRLAQTTPPEGRGAAWAKDVQNTPAIGMEVWMPAGAPTGQWYASVYAPGASTAGSFDVPPRPVTPMVTLGRPPKYLFPKADPLGPLLGDYTYQEQPDLQVKSGDGIKLFGVGFKPYAVIPIGAYRLSHHESGNDQADLMGATEAPANARGEWSVTYRVGANEPPGNYVLIAVLDTNQTSGHFAGINFSYSVLSWQPCPNTYASMLAPGMRAKVIEGQKNNRLRAQPTRYGDNVIGSIPAGQPFDILDGPRCADNWVWWYVRAPDGQKGWTAEGDRGERWLNPVE